MVAVVLEVAVGVTIVAPGVGMTHWCSKGPGCKRPRLTNKSKIH